MRSLRTISKRVLRENSNVLQVALFGSLATGQCVPGSDADVLVVLKEDDRRFMDRIPEFARIFLEAPISADIFPYTEREIQTMLSIGNCFAARAWKERIILAERSDIG